MSALSIATRACRADQLVDADLGALVEFQWQAATFDGPLLGFTRSHVKPGLDSDCEIPVQLLIEVGHDFGPQWFDVEDATEVRVTRSQP